MLGNVLVLSDIKILEHWFQVNSPNDNSFLVLIEDIGDGVLFLLGHIQVLSSGESGVVLGNSGNNSLWILLNSISGEGRVNAVAESLIVDQKFWVVSSVFIGHLVEFFLSEIEIKHRENAFKLTLGNLSFSEFVKVKEELLNSDSLHDNKSSESILNVRWAV